MKKGEVWRVRLPFALGTNKPANGLLSLSSKIPTTLRCLPCCFAGTLLVQPDSQNGLTVPSVALVFQIERGG
jgi:hypothetical protein